MTSRRFNTSPSLTPARTGGDDRPAGACYGNPLPFDVLIDRTSGPASKLAVTEAAAICGTCPIRDACWTANADEPWVRALAGHRPDFVGEKRRTMTNARAAERQAVLEGYVERGALLEEVQNDLGLTRHQVYKWCHRHHRLDIWRDLTPHLKPNQHRQKSVAA